MTSWAVTVNVGGGPGCTPDRVAGMTRWAAAALKDRSPAVVFAQEVPSEDWLQLWRSAGYTVTLGEDRGWTVRSALLTSPGLDVAPLTSADAANLRYHGSYVAAARWTSPVGPVVLASVHASPQLAEPELYGWAGPRPDPRSGGGDQRAAAHRLWDSDMLLDTLAGLAQEGSVPVLAAGDYNEAREYDVDRTSGQRLGTWGQEYFDRAAQHGLRDWLFEVWGQERPTRGHLQLAHVLVSGPVAALLNAEPAPHVDPHWRAGARPELSDHAPVWFALRH